MNPDLSSSPVTYKDLLLKKITNPVFCSLFSQLVILQLYVFVVNFNLMHPLEWISASFRTFTSITAWFFIVPFMAIVFAQSIICSKDYVYKTVYCSTRFQKFVSIFSTHNFYILTLNMLVGMMLSWLLLYLGDAGQYLTISCKKNNNTTCLNKNVFFVLLNGVWNGFYFFTRIHMSHEKYLEFPVVHQKKLLQFKTEVIPLLKSSFWMYLTPSVYYVVFFYFWGNALCKAFHEFFGLAGVENNNESYNIFLFMYIWIFGTIYCFSVKLMQFFFNLFLTEPVEFPLEKQSSDLECLQISINKSDLPIIQHLACLDLYNLSQWSPMRRQVLFTLSQPGGHPHNWNALVENVLKLFATHVELLEKTTSTTEATGVNNVLIPQQQPLPPVMPFQSPILSYNKFYNLRNMSMVSTPNSMVDVVEMTRSPKPFIALPTNVPQKIREKLKNAIAFLKVVLGINYLFGEIPQANVQKFLSNGYVLMWTSQGISGMVCASLTEDKFGVVQKDLPAIIASLVQLKQQLDKLNKIPALTRKMFGQEDFYIKMMNAVTAAVKRSLFNICNRFGKYLVEVPLNKEVLAQLQTIYKD